MPQRRALDSELVRRGLARSIVEARALVASGRVRVAGQPASKPATQVRADVAITVAAAESGPRYVSRGAHKLAGALDAFAPAGLSVAGRSCLDAGASTGGFTDVLLRRGAARVVAVDVAYGELAWSLRTDARVRVIERTNVRELTPEQLGGLVDVVVGDLSFISLTAVLPALARVCRPRADLVLMVKPQFEVARANVEVGGVVHDPDLRAAAVRGVADAAAALGIGTLGVTASPLPGPAGNVEYFLWLGAGSARLCEQDLRRAIEAGPSGRVEPQR